MRIEPNDAYVLGILRDDMERTQQEYAKAREDFWKVSGEVSSGMHEIELAARAQTVAMLAYTTALHRFNEFVLTGKVPDDLLSRCGVISSQSQMEKCIHCGTPTRRYVEGQPICTDCAERLDATESS